MNLPVDEARIRLARQRDALLHDIWLGQRGADCLLPTLLADLPSEDDPLAAVLVVRLQHQLLAMRGDKGEEVHWLLGSAGRRRRSVLDDARPRDVDVDRFAFVG